MILYYEQKGLFSLQGKEARGLFNYFEGYCIEDGMDLFPIRTQENNQSESLERHKNEFPHSQLPKDGTWGPCWIVSAQSGSCSNTDKLIFWLGSYWNCTTILRAPEVGDKVSFKLEHCGSMHMNGNLKSISVETHWERYHRAEKEAKRRPDYITNRLFGSSDTCSGILGTRLGTAEDKMAPREVHCRCPQSVGPEVLALQWIVEVGPPWWFTTQGGLSTQMQSVVWLHSFTG